MISIIEKIISRKDARALEDKFFQQAEIKLQSTEGVWSPIDNRFYRVVGGVCNKKVLADRTLKDALKGYDLKSAVINYVKMPKNKMLVCEVCHKAPKVAIAFASFSPLAELLEPGYTAQKAGTQDLAKIISNIAVNPYLYYYISVFSTTGFEDEVKRTLVGNNFVVALTDYYNGVLRTYYPPSDLWNVNFAIFEFATREDKIRCVKQFIKSHTLELILGEMTEERVLAEVGFDREIIREAFKEVAQIDGYVKFNSGLGSLVRVY